MSICEHMIEKGDSASKSSSEKLLNIQNELIWGLTYRNYKENEKHKPISPIHSPINIPFELCRAEMLKKRRTKSEFDAVSEEEEIDSVSADKVAKKSKRQKKRKLSTEKPSLLDRSTWPQTKYMDFLSMPNPTFFQEPKKKKYKKRCELEPCPPRFTQLAVPNKRRVFANWKDYAGFLPTEMLMRFEEILHTDQNLEPKEARYYYKKLDRQKHKELRKKRRRENKRKQQEEKDDWQMNHIYLLASDIVDYIKDEPLFALNYKQMLLSDAILDRLGQTNLIKKPSRKTKNHFNKTIIEVSDKFAIWIDTLTKFVDVQAIESDEDIPPVSISSLSGEGEGEDDDESDYDSSSDEELRDDQFFERTEGMWDDGEEGMGQFGDKENAEAAMQEFFRPEEGEDAAEFEQMLNNLDGDALEKLITILSNCSDDFLGGEIDADKMPGVRYRDVLDKLKALRDGLTSAGGKPFLEQIMIDWAIRNDPDNVTDEILQKIHEVAGLLGDFLSEKKPSDGVVKGAEGTGAEGAGAEGAGAEGAGAEGADAEGTDAEGAGAEGGQLEEERTASAAEVGGESVGEEGLAGAQDDGAGAEGAGAEGAGAEDVGAEDVGAEDVGAEDVGAEGAGAEGAGAEGAGAEGAGAEGAGAESEQLEEERAASAAEVGGESVVGQEGEQPTAEKEGDMEEGIPSATPGTSGYEQGGADDAGTSAAPGDTLDEVAGEGESSGATDLELDLDHEGDVAEREEVSDLEGVEKLKDVHEGAGVGAGGEVGSSVLLKPKGPTSEVGAVGMDTVPGSSEVQEAHGLEGKIIKGHKPSKVFEHALDTVCCLSLKTWAVWLLEITHNAHNWTQWMSCVIQQIREYAAIVRGDVKGPNGEASVLRKAEWRKFIKETDASIVACRQYSAHVKDLSQSIVDNFHGKKVNCCPKCLQDHLITDVVVAHETLQALTEAINCAAYWQRCLDTLVDKTCSLTQDSKGDDEVVDDLEVSSDEYEVDIEELEERTDESEESVYDIEDLESQLSKYMSEGLESTIKL